MTDIAKHLIVTDRHACAISMLENYPGEIFSTDKFSVVSVGQNQLSSYSVTETVSKMKICLLRSSWGNYPETDLSKFDLIVVIDRELINEESDFYFSKLAKKLNNNRIVLIVGGYRKSITLARHKVHIYPYLLLNIGRYNKMHKVDSLNQYQKIFDALLGMNKPHRNFIIDNLKSTGLIDQCYVNLTSNRWTEPEPLRTVYRSPGLAELDLDEQMKYQTNDVFDSYVGPSQSIAAQFIPWNIYKNSLYSIVTETNWGDIDFFTEKTAKCLFARRLFVFFCSQGQLEDLRNMGFMTFNSIIDESYDKIENNTERWHQAFQQVIALSQADHHKVYQSCEKIWTHNQQHLNNRSFFLDPLKNWLKNYIPNIV